LGYTPEGHPRPALRGGNSVRPKDGTRSAIKIGGILRPSDVTPLALSDL
jgi:hypothetical protein